VYPLPATFVPNAAIASLVVMLPEAIVVGVYRIKVPSVKLIALPLTGAPFGVPALGYVPAAVTVGQLSAEVAVQDAIAVE
jgi:hypothetical protein